MSEREKRRDRLSKDSEREVGGGRQAGTQRGGDTADSGRISGVKTV